MSTQFKSSDEVVKILRQADVEIATYKRDEGILELTIPVDDPVEDLELDDFERGFVTAFCLEINDRVRAEYAELGHVDTEELPCDDWSERFCRVPWHYSASGEEPEKVFDINYGFIEDNGSYRFWATAYALNMKDKGDAWQTDGNSYVRIV